MQYWAKCHAGRLHHQNAPVHPLQLLVLARRRRAHQQRTVAECCAVVNIRGDACLWHLPALDPSPTAWSSTFSNALKSRMTNNCPMPPLPKALGIAVRKAIACRLSRSIGATKTSANDGPEMVCQRRSTGRVLPIMAGSLAATTCPALFVQISAL